MRNPIAFRRSLSSLVAFSTATTIGLSFRGFVIRNSIPVLNSPSNIDRIPKGRAREKLTADSNHKSRIGELDALGINAASSLLAKLITMSMSDFSSRPMSWLQQMGASIGPLGELIYPRCIQLADSIFETLSRR